MTKMDETPRLAIRSTYIYEQSEKLGKSRWKLGFRFEDARTGEDTDVIDPLCQRERGLGGGTRDTEGLVESLF